ncbi:TPA: hypothetical protein ACH2I9_004202 [Enterobacter asburiae]
MEHKKEDGGIVSLLPDSNNTVQSVALIRLGLFVLGLKSRECGRTDSMVTNYVTDVLWQHSLACSEQYEKTKITDERLDMDNDFKVWIGIIHVISKFHSLSKWLKLPCVNFVKFYYISTAHCSAKLRKRIEAFLGGIAAIVLKADPCYQFDRKVLLQPREINTLPSKKSAMALYTIIKSLLPDPVLISIRRS